MRTVFLACLAAPLVIAGCKLLKHGGADAGSDAASSASASASDAPADAAPEASATPTTHVSHAAGPPAAGNPCASGKDSPACSHDGFEELSCAGGAWRVLQTCRGAGGCKADSSGVHCDVGSPHAGDVCPPTAVASCTNRNTVLACQNGKWVSSLCVPPATCQPTANHGTAGCK